MLRVFVLSIFYFVSVSASADVIEISSIKESFSEKVKVSGTFYLGMQFNTGDKVEKLNILFPDNSTGKLCMKISSIDGRYKASLEHDLDTPVSGLNQLGFHSKYENDLKGYKPGELAIDAYLAKSCDKPQGKYLAAAWSDSIKDKNIIVLIRSDARKDVVKIEGQPEGFKCKKFKNEYKVTYDKYCELQGVDITKIPKLTIKRKNLQVIPDEILNLAYK